jgi:hypothetical protein
MTSSTIFKIQVAAEGSLAVMTSDAGSVSGGEVFEGPRRTNLSFLRQARRVVMTIRAPETLAPAVLRVTEGDPEGGRVGWSSAKRFLIVTDPTRCQVASVGLRVWRMTGVALVMRGKIRRNWQRYSAPERRGMTWGAAILWTRRAGHVLCMIELHVEAFFELVRKGFQRWIAAAHVGVADRAHGHIRIGKLRQMTTGAILVARKTGPRRIIIPMMTSRAGSLSVTLTGVQEFWVVEIVSLRVSQGGRQ